MFQSDRQIAIRSTVKKFVCAGSKDDQKTISVFIEHFTCAGRAKEVQEKVDRLLKNPKVADAIKFKARACKRKRVQEEDYCALRFIDRKLEGVGRERENKFKQSRKETESLEMSEVLELSPLKKKLSSWDDAKAHNFFKKNVPNMPAVRVNPTKTATPQSKNDKDDAIVNPTVEMGPDGIDVEHASTNPMKLFGGILTMALAEQKLHPNFIWFWDPLHKCPRILHTEWGLCLDGFPIHGFSDGAAMQSVQLYNLPGLVHKPQFVFPQAVYIDQESSRTAWTFLRELDECAAQLELSAV